MALSGYALIFSDLDGKGYRNVVETAWNKYLETIQDPKGVIHLLLNALDVKASLFSLFPRDIVRARWQLSLQRHLAERGLLPDDVPWHFGGRRSHSGSTPLIRAIVASGLLVQDAEEAFAALYLAARPEVAGLELPMIVEHFLRGMRLHEAAESDEDDEA